MPRQCSVRRSSRNEGVTASALTIIAMITTVTMEVNELRGRKPGSASQLRRAVQRVKPT